MIYLRREAPGFSQKPGFSLIAAFVLLCSVLLSALAPAVDAAPGSPLAPQADGKWAEDFVLNGANSYVQAIAVHGSQTYVGGRFDMAGDTPAAQVAAWDGAAWAPLGSGMINAGGSYTDIGVYALATDSAGNLYAGGTFAKAGSVTARRVAKWDGSDWSALGAGLGSASSYYDGAIVYALALDAAGNLYAGGKFTIGGQNLARWDGSAWSDIGAANGVVRALVVDGSTLYAAGEFTTIGGVSANRVARWDGSTWSPLAAGFQYTVYGLTLANGSLYAVGGGGAVARWDGAAWVTVGGALAKPDGAVKAVRWCGGKLYIGGVFSSVGGVASRGIAAWNGTAWEGLAAGVKGGTNKEVLALAESPAGELLVGGDFTQAGSLRPNYIAGWTGTAWRKLGADTTVNGPVKAIALDGTNVYVGGDFTEAGGQPAAQVAMWDGAAWHPLAAGLPGRTSSSPPNEGVRALAFYQGQLYAGGDFQAANGAPSSFIARWDGATWQAVSSPINAAVYALAADGQYLYAGGRIDTPIGLNDRQYVARWDGQQWTKLVGQAGLNSTIYDLTVANGVLYAAGAFFSLSTLGPDGVARWDGTDWQRMGSWGTSTVFTIASDREGVVYASNNAHINRWDGASWQVLADGGGRELYYSPVDDRLYKGESAGYWTGAAWEPVGPLAPSAAALAMDAAGRLWAGGYFSMAGGHVSRYFGRWNTNHAPAASSFTVVGTEDTLLALSRAGFAAGFSDIDGDALAAVTITGLPSTGTLRLAGVAVTAGQEIPAGQLDALAFTPAANWHGDVTLRWQGSDGSLYSGEATVTLAIAAVNDAPVMTDFTRTAPSGQPVHFAQGDFTAHFSDVDGDPLVAVRVETLPGEGSLTVGAAPVAAGDVLSLAQIDDLAYQPPAGWSGPASFRWNGSDGAAYAAQGATVTLLGVQRVFLPLVLR